MLLRPLWCLPCFFILFNFFYYFFPPDILQSGSRYWTRRGALTVHEEWRLFTWDNGSRHPRLASSYCFIWQKVSLESSQDLGRFFSFCWNLWWLHCNQEGDLDCVCICPSSALLFLIETWWFGGVAKEEHPCPYLKTLLFLQDMYGSWL